jgi:hypothetical protein
LRGPRFPWGSQFNPEPIWLFLGGTFNEAATGVAAVPLPPGLKNAVLKVVQPTMLRVLVVANKLVRDLTCASVDKEALQNLHM